MKLSYLILALFCISTVAALEQVIVEEGETIVVRVDTHARKGASEIAADFSIAELGYHHYISDRYPGDSIIEDQITLDAPPGTYILNAQLYVNKAFVRRESIAITILGEGETLEQQRPTERVAPVQPARLTIAPIPDVTPGTTLVLPVKITGNGTYQLHVPKLDFATYEVPAPVTVRGEATTSVLMHVHENAQPGTYTVPVRAGNEEASVRVRVIQYKEQSESLSVLIPVALFIILLGLLLLLFMRRKGGDERRKEEPKTRDDQPDSELITYY